MKTIKTILLFAAGIAIGWGLMILIDAIDARNQAHEQEEVVNKLKGEII